jgi:predicted kinase
MLSAVDCIIIDNTNITLKEFTGYLDHAIAFGYEVKVMEPATSWKHDVEVCFERNTHNVPREVIERMKKRYTPIDELRQKVVEYMELDEPQ